MAIPAVLAAILKPLLGNGLNLVGNAVIAKGKDWVENKLGVELKPDMTADEIIQFAKLYDPLPMHLSAEGGKDTVHASLISSGVLTIALKQRLIMSIERNTAIIGAVRIDNQQFLKPVRPGDDLTMKQVCTGTRRSRSRPDRGLLFCEFRLTNQKGEMVFSSDDTVMVRRKPAD